MKALTLLLLATLALRLNAQVVCDSTLAPVGLAATYTVGVGAQLSWSPVPASIGVQIEATLVDGPTLVRILVGPELDQFLLPDADLFPGQYTWRVQAACGETTPFPTTPFSEPDSFFVPRRSLCTPTVTDIDGHVYDVIQIGGPTPGSPDGPSTESGSNPVLTRGQCWMARNLEVERYTNGDSLALGLTDEQWQETVEGAAAVYKDNAVNRTRYGLLYNAFAVQDPRGVCPVGWHLPSHDEWTNLVDYLGGPKAAGGRLKQQGNLLDGGLWLEPNAGASNSSGFTALPGGNRSPSGDYAFASVFGSFWTATPASPKLSWQWILNYKNNAIYRTVSPNNNGLSVRCVED
jgi:uncharacterized protein (TIGR02145 family)